MAKQSRDMEGGVWHVVSPLQHCKLVKSVPFTTSIFTVLPAGCLPLLIILLMATEASPRSGCFTSGRGLSKHAELVMQVVEFVKSEDYARFTRIVFDTAPTGHTLRLLTVPDFVEASLGKLIRLRRKLTAAGDAVRGLFGVTNHDAAIQKLESLRVCKMHRWCLACRMASTSTRAFCVVTSTCLVPQAFLLAEWQVFTAYSKAATGCACFMGFHSPSSPVQHIACMIKLENVCRRA